MDEKNPRMLNSSNDALDQFRRTCNDIGLSFFGFQLTAACENAYSLTEVCPDPLKNCHQKITEGLA